MPIEESARATIRHEKFLHEDVYTEGTIKYVKLTAVYDRHRRFYLEYELLEFYKKLRVAKHRRGNNLFMFYPALDVGVALNDIWVAAPPSNR